MSEIHPTIRPTCAELGFESCAQTVADYLADGGEVAAFSSALNFRRNLAHDSCKLMERAREIVRARWSDQQPENNGLPHMVCKDAAREGK